MFQKIVLIRGVVTLWIILFFLSISFAGTKDQNDNDPHITGLIPFTHDQEVAFRREHLQIKKVKLNHLGFKRVNEARAKNKFYLLDEEVVAPEGKDLESTLGAASDTTQSSSNPETMGVLPVGVDNSKTSWFPPIRSQGSLASCVSWATTYYQLTYMNAMAKGLTVNTGDNTQIFSPKWTYNMVNNGQNGGTYFSDNYNLLKNHGVAKWSEFPYDSNYLSWNLDPGVWRNAISSRTNTVQYVYSASSSTGLQQIKELLTNGYILVFGTYINSWQYTTIKNDPATIEDDAVVGQSVAYWLNGNNGAHAMTIVGFNDAIWSDINNNGSVDFGEKGAFRIANSWGTGWGNGGFTWLAYDALKNTSTITGAPNTGRVAAFQSDMVYELTLKPNYIPKMIAEFTVNHLKRNQLGMFLGLSDPTVNTPSTYWYPLALNYKGGPYAFNGLTTAVNGTFVFDFSDILPSGTVQKKYYLGMRDSTSLDPAILLSYKLIDLTTNNESQALGLPLSVDGGQQLFSTIDYTYSDGNYSPVADMTATPSSGNAPLSVNFDGSRSVDSDGTIVSYQWNFGDGAQGSGVNINHVYSAPGSFNAGLTVADDKGATGLDSVGIMVSPDPDVISPPSNLNAIVLGKTIALNWTDNSNNEGGFYVEQGIIPKGSRDVAYSRVKQVLANVTNASINVVASGNYYYRAQAYNLATEKNSSYSNEIKVRIK